MERKSEVVERLVSRRGVPVTLQREYCPDSRRVPYLTLIYSTGKNKGTRVYYLENARMAGEVERVRSLFLADRDSLGHPIVSRRRRSQAA